MRITYVRYGVLAALLAVAMACSEVTPPTAPSPRGPTPTSPPPDPTFPAVLRPARVYVYPSSVLASSRYVFYDDGAFTCKTRSTIGSTSIPGPTR